jgi:hypothetical protein
MAIVFNDGTQSTKSHVGRVLQSHLNAIAVRTNGTNGTWYDLSSGWEVSITPRSTSSQILITYTINGWCTWDSGVRLVRNGTAIGIGAAAGSRPSMGYEFPSANRNNEMGCHSNSYLDSPNTTSTLTYKLQGWWNGSAWYVNRTGSDDNSVNDGRAASSIIVTEVLG